MSCIVYWMACVMSVALKEGQMSLLTMYWAMKSERLTLAMEVESLRVELKDLRCELSKVKEEVWGVRQGNSVRPKARSEVVEAWPLVGEARRGGDSAMGRVESERKVSGKLTIRRVDNSQEWRVVSRGRVGTGSSAE